MRILPFHVMADLGCQFDWIWNQLKHKVLGTPARNSLIQSVWRGTPHSSCRCHLLVAAQMKGHGRRKASLLACLPPLLLEVHLFCGCNIPLLMLEPASLGFQCRRKTGSSPRVPQAVSTRLAWLSNYWILSPSGVKQSLAYCPNHIM